MLLFVIAMIFFLIALAIVLVGKVQDRDRVISIRKWALVPFAFGLLLLMVDSYDTVAPGQVGIPVTFGTTGAPLGTGIHLVSPFTDVTHLSVKTKEYTMAADPTDGSKNGNDAVAVAGHDGAQGAVDVTVLYHIDEPKASEVFRNLGSNYEVQVVRPTVRDCIVHAYKAYPIVEAKTVHLSDVTADATDCVKNGLDGISQGLAGRGFVVEALQIRNTSLDASVQSALDAKVAASTGKEQALSDGETARIKAQATADSQQIIKCGSHNVEDTTQASGVRVVANTGGDCQNQLTPEYLQWAYIDMMKSISNSPNHDTIIIPSGETINPIINMPAGGQSNGGN